MKFQVIGITEDLFHRLPLERIHQARRRRQPRPENRMPQIRFGFLDRRDAEPRGHRAMAQALELREDEPHPVALFAAGPQLGAGLLIYRVLRLNKSLQMENIAHIIWPCMRTATPRRAWYKMG